MKPILVILFAFFVGQLCKGQERSTLSLQEAIDQSTANSIDAQQAELNLALAKADADLIEASLKPRVVANANLPNYFNTSQSVVQPDGSLAFQDVSQNVGQLGVTASKAFAETNTNVFVQTNLVRFDDFSTDFTGYNGFPLRVGVNQPINQFNQTKWNRKMAQQNQVLQLALAQQNIGSNAVAITQQYFRLLRAQVNQEIAQTNRKNATEIYEIGKERYKLGKISKNDLLQIELSLNRSKQDEVSASRDVIEQSYQLKNVANLFGLANVIEVFVPEDLPQILLSGEDIAEMAWENNPTNQQLNMLQLQSDQELERASKENGFQANLQASVGLTKSGTELNEVYQNPKNETLVNLSLSMPLFDGQFRKKAQQRAQLNQNYQQVNREYNEVSFKQNVMQLVQQIELLREEVAMSKTSFELAEERYNIANQRFALGNINTTDLTIAYSERDLAWRSYILTIESFFVNYEVLKQITQYDFETNQRIEYLKD